jgi:hypothetical protein
LGERSLRAQVRSVTLGKILSLVDGHRAWRTPAQPSASCAVSCVQPGESASRALTLRAASAFAPARVTEAARGFFVRAAEG